MDTDFPLSSFPNKIRILLTRMVSTENFPIEFCASAMLSAAAAGIGNVYQVRIKSHWVNNPALFMMIAGRPGLGKTPPLEAAYRPLKRLDQQRVLSYLTELKAYEEVIRKQGNDPEAEIPPKPILVQTVLSDFTTESMMQTHEYNKRGIAIVVDEIMGMFNSVDRYGKGGNQLETFLSAFSGSSLKVSRKGSPIPFMVNNPCVSIIGTIQIERFEEIFSKGLEKSGLIDRFIVVFPKEQDIPLWDLNQDEEATINGEKDTFVEWDSLMRRIFSLEPKYNELGDIEPKILEFSLAAKKELFTWRNLKVKRLSEYPEPGEVESREMKRAQIVSKISLTLQVLKWACGEGALDCVDLESIKGAIALNEYYEDCYYRILNVLEKPSETDRNNAFLSKLPQEFTTKDAFEAGKEFRLGERGMKKLLKKLVNSNRIRRLKVGQYSKVIEDHPIRLP